MHLTAAQPPSFPPLPKPPSPLRGHPSPLRTKLPGRTYSVLKVLFRSVLAMTMRWRITGMEHQPPTGGYLLAVCHLNHLDPIILSAAMSRRIGWIARKEFFQHRSMRRFLLSTGAFPVDRQGYARPALREALARLAQGEVVGIFPEGEIMSGPDSVLRGGKLRQGLAWLALHSGKPILPVVVLGTDRLCTLDPWLPAWRGRLWLTVGAPLWAPAGPADRTTRAAFTATLEATFRQLFNETRQRHQLPETIVP